MRGAKCLTYFFASKKLAKLITNIPANKRTDYFNSMYVCLWHRFVYGCLREQSIKANDLRH